MVLVINLFFTRHYRTSKDLKERVDVIGGDAVTHSEFSNLLKAARGQALLTKQQEVMKKKKMYKHYRRVSKVC